MSPATTVPERSATAAVAVAESTVALPEPLVPAVTVSVPPEILVMVIVTVLPAVLSNDAA